MFGGQVLQSADVSQRTVSLTADVELVWPAFGTTNTDYVAGIMDVTASSSGLNITMPPANQVSTGEDILFTNPGSNTFNVLKNDGTVIVSVAAGQDVLIYVTDNTTEAGSWNSILLGTSSSELSAGSVEGYGVVAIGSTLNAASQVATTSTNTSIAVSDRAKTFVWTGGAGTFTLPAVAVATDDFFFHIRNQGSGTLTFSPTGGELIDGSASIALQPNDSAIVHAGPMAWYTVGRGRNTQFNFTRLVKTVTGGSTTLTNTEAASVIQTYNGVLASNQTIVFPPVVQTYYVSNQTSGAYTITFQSPTPGDQVTLQNSQNAILICDGVNVINATTGFGAITSVTLNPATAANPSINFSGDTDTGIFQPASGTVGFSVNASEIARVTANGFTMPAGAVGTPSVNFGSATTGLYAPGANQLAVAISGAQAGSVNSNKGWTISNLVAGWGGTAGGTADARTISLTQPLLAYAAGQQFTFINGAASNTSTTPTINIDGVGAVTIVKLNGSPVSAGDLVASGLVELVYDGTNMRMLPVVPQNPSEYPLFSQTVAAAASISITGLTNAYDEYAIYLYKAKPVVDDDLFYMRTSTNGGVSYDSGGSDYEVDYTMTRSSTVTGLSSTGSVIPFTGSSGSGVGNVAAGENGADVFIRLIRPSDALYFTVYYTCVYRDSSNRLTKIEGTGQRLASADVDAVQFAFLGGNISSALVRMYGRKYA